MTDFSERDDAPHHRWMQRCLQLAHRAAEQGEVPVGAVVVAHDKIVGEGWNQPIGACDPTAHAEIMALRAAAKRLNNYRLADCDLYVSLEPCTMCAGAIVHARIRRLIFAASEPRSGAACSQQTYFDAAYLNHRVEVVAGVLAQASSEILTDFFRQKRREKGLSGKK